MKKHIEVTGFMKQRNLTKVNKQNSELQDFMALTALFAFITSVIMFALSYA